MRSVVFSFAITLAVCVIGSHEVHSQVVPPGGQPLPVEVEFDAKALLNDIVAEQGSTSETVPYNAPQKLTYDCKITVTNNTATPKTFRLTWQLRHGNEEGFIYFKTITVPANTTAFPEECTLNKPNATSEWTGSAKVVEMVDNVAGDEWGIHTYTFVENPTIP
ncbi:MAG: hypothetical protein Q8M16_08870 [Pirellulaceae bacterium]|nr:hypothetical protein [Pirellulaceae bacterium]